MPKYRVLVSRPVSGREEVFVNVETDLNPFSDEFDDFVFRAAKKQPLWDIQDSTLDAGIWDWEIEDVKTPPDVPPGQEKLDL